MGEASRPRVDDIALVAGCLDESLALLRVALDGLKRDLRSLAGNAARLNHDLSVMGALETNGRIEASRAADALGIVQLFREMNDQIGKAAAGVEQFSAVAKLGGAIASRTAMAQLDDAVARIRHDASRLAEQTVPAEPAMASLVAAGT